MNVKKVTGVYLTGFFLATALILFPACGNIMLNKDFHGFTESQYGLIFIPQIVFAIIASLTASKLAEKIGMKKVLILGLILTIGALFLLFLSKFFLVGETDYWIIMGATAFMGAGFGYGLTALNPFASNLFPDNEASALTGLHVLTGLGGAASGFVISIFLDLEMWWMAPLVILGILIAAIVVIISLNLETKEQSESSNDKDSSGIPKRVWFYASLVFLYGTCEALLNNYGSIFIEQEAGFSASVASTGHSILWISIALGRLLFALVAIKFNTKWFYMIIPFVLFAGIFLLPQVESKFLVLGGMALGGLGLSFLFPNTISEATSEYPEKESLISGIMVASLQLGSGVSSNLVGYLSDSSRDTSLDLSIIFNQHSFLALGIGVVVIYLVMSRKKTSA